MSLESKFSLAIADNPELPSCDNLKVRWTPARKEAVVLHILDQERGELKSVEAALEYYSAHAFSKEEIQGWINTYKSTRGTRSSLETTKLQEMVRPIPRQWDFES